MKLLASIATSLIVAAVACGGEVAGQQPAAAVSDRVYTLDSLSSVGWKSKGGFTRSFAPATGAEWGFLDGREVAVIIYGTPTEAREHGTVAGKQQTETTAEGTYGPEVERTKCSGFANLRTPYRLAPPAEGQFCAARGGGLGVSETCTLARVEALAGGESAGSRGSEVHFQPTCPKRVPTYAEYTVEGNLVLLCEAKTEDRKAECSLLIAKLRAT